jgi:NAD+ synthase (glutamine-hydrolysing)
VRDAYDRCVTTARAPRFALGQVEVKAGMPDDNVARMLSMIERAKALGADLITFPEMCVGGYLLGDKWLDDDYCLSLMRYNERLVDASRGIAVAWGNVFLDRDLKARGLDGYHPNKDGRTRRYNAIYVAQDGRWARRKSETKFLPRGVHVKTLLPNYRFFDDERYFFSLQDIAIDFGVPLRRLQQPFLIRCADRVLPIGFELCEDLWCADYRKEGQALNPTKMLIKNGARLIMNGSSSPWTFGKNGARDRRVRFLKQDSGERFVPFLYVNVVGAQNNGKNVITFDGGSTVYDEEGRAIVHASKPYEEELIVVEDFSTAHVPRVEDPKIAQKFRALIQGIRHLKDIRGVKNDPIFIVGMSGGIDSSVSAALLVHSVGKERVFGVNMPTRFNSTKTIKAAQGVAQALGIAYREVPIGDLVEINRQLLNNADLDGKQTLLTTLNEENVQAKIRGTAILSNLAAKYGGVFSNHGNKLEIALGYATLYGDWGGAVSILGDLTKTEIYDLARYINRHVFEREIIPETLLPDELFRFRPDQIPPTAELKDDQIDPMKFGYHCALLEAMTDYKKRTVEDVLRWYLEGTLHEELDIPVELLQRWDVHKPETFLEDLDWFARNVQNSVFKRVQSPPIIVTSKSAYGYDIRESMLPYHESEEAKRLKAEIRATLTEYRPADPGESSP